MSIQVPTVFSKQMVHRGLDTVPIRQYFLGVKYIKKCNKWSAACFVLNIYIYMHFTLEPPQSKSPLAVVMAIFRYVTGVLGMLVIMDVWYWDVDCSSGNMCLCCFFFCDSQISRAASASLRLSNTLAFTWCSRSHRAASAYLDYIVSMNLFNAP